jgi:hypothetical protein
MEMNFVLKHYKKGATIQLKPVEDISTDPARCVHFSIAWFANQNKLDQNKSSSKEEQRLITAQLFSMLIDYLKTTNNKLSFKIVKACENCTYGHFDTPFEDIVSHTRQQHNSLNTEKDLPLHLHPELPQNVPIMFHIAHSRSTNAAFNDFLKVAGDTLTINVSILEVNK